MFDNHYIVSYCKWPNIWKLLLLMQVVESLLRFPMVFLSSFPDKIPRRHFSFVSGFSIFLGNLGHLRQTRHRNRKSHRGRSGAKIRLGRGLLGGWTQLVAKSQAQNILAFWRASFFHLREGKQYGYYASCLMMMYTAISIKSQSKASECMNV